MTADEAADILAQAVRAAHAAGATDWPALRRALQVALVHAETMGDLVNAAARAGAPRRLDLIEMRDALIREIAHMPRYAQKGRGGNRAIAEAIANDLADYQSSRFYSDGEVPQHDPDRLFHRIISNGSAVIGGQRRPLGWNSIYRAIGGVFPTE